MRLDHFFFVQHTVNFQLCHEIGNVVLIERVRAVLFEDFSVEKASERKACANLISICLPVKAFSAFLCSCDGLWKLVKSRVFKLSQPRAMQQRVVTRLIQERLYGLCQHDEDIFACRVSLFSSNTFTAYLTSFKKLSRRNVFVAKVFHLNSAFIE